MLIVRESYVIWHVAHRKQTESKSIGFLSQNTIKACKKYKSKTVVDFACNIGVTDRVRCLLKLEQQQKTTI